ncbi:MAG: MoaD family protein [Chloroflexi bacterium]|uniref:MoaD family protein n=1 Tax=Candidatus Chlorohelix allophototropha TaxID=3003348 RepID=A0A8T7M6F0_9CHLR|nr:MoaD family protein [Chloroflexota bacterium]WJW69558.1 MoaD family protein [Chloroflexota bacterium L227-S17]
MSNIKLPPVLRKLSGGVKEVQVEGATVGELLDNLDRKYPTIKNQLLTEDGEIARYVNLYLNDEDVRFLQGLVTPVKESDTIVILPAMSGGSL